MAVIPRSNNRRMYSMREIGVLLLLFTSLRRGCENSILVLPKLDTDALLGVVVSWVCEFAVNRGCCIEPRRRVPKKILWRSFFFWTSSFALFLAPQKLFENIPVDIYDQQGYLLRTHSTTQSQRESHADLVLCNTPLSKLLFRNISSAAIPFETDTTILSMIISLFLVWVTSNIVSIVSALAASHVAPVTPKPAAAVAPGRVTPHGGTLMNSMVYSDEQVQSVIKSCHLTVSLNERQLCDVELLMQGGFSPLDSFMDEADYKSVVNTMKLTSGLLFGLPVVLDTDSDDDLVGKRLLLTYKTLPIAALDVTSKYIPDKVVEAHHCYGTTSIEHPGVHMITTERGRYYCGGKVTGLNVPPREFPCKSPAEVRSELPADTDVIAFQCRNPIHRAHYELFMRALEDPAVRPGAVVLVHPTCGPTQADDIPGEVRFRTYEVLRQQIQNPRVRWAYLPYSMHMAGPREAIQHMIIRKNYGCSHFIIGRDMAGCKSSLTGENRLTSPRQSFQRIYSGTMYATRQGFLWAV